MGNRNELYASDTVNDDGAEAINITATTVGTKRHMDAESAPITAIKTITPSSNTDVNFDHRFIYTGDGGAIAVRFAASGTVYTFTLPAGGLMPMTVYSIDTFAGSDIHLMA